MYKYRSKPKQSSLQRFTSAIGIFAAGIAAIAVVAIVPSVPSRHSNARIITQGLTITLDQSSPAFAAMEDALIVPDYVETQTSDREPEVVHYLAAGQGSAEMAAYRIMRDNRREDSLIAQARASREAAAKALAQAAADAFRKVASVPVQSRASVPTKQSAIKQDVSQAISGVTTAKREVINHPTRTISLTDLKMSREELIKSFVAPIAVAAAEVTEMNVMVAGGRGLPRAVSPRSFAQPQLGGLERKASWAPTIPPPTNRMIAPPSANPSAGGSAATRGVDTPNQLTISGSIEFSGGLALSNPSDVVTVYRERDGEVIEQGMVWIREGRYKIFVDQADGNLIGELRTPHGDVLGRGLIDLAQAVPARAQAQVDKIALKLSPLAQGIAGRVTSTGDTADGKATPMAEAQVSFQDLPLSAVTFRDGRFEESTLIEGSTALLKAHKPLHWSTLALASAAQESELSLFSQKTIAALQVAASEKDLREKGIVMGTVRAAGKPTAGANVAILSTQVEMQPIYFNEKMEPDASLKATSSNGRYAFVGVPLGPHSIQAAAGGRVLPPVVLPVEDNHVSQGDLETASEQRTRVKMFDAFRTDWPLSGEVVPPGVSQGWRVDRSGETVVSVPKGSGSFVVDVDAGPAYERSRITVSRDRRSIYSPMVQATWLNKVRGSMRANNEPQTGVVVGFVQGQTKYRVALEEKSVLQATRIVYFDSRGEPTQEDFGQPGGGFILFNVPEGFRTIAIQPEGRSKMFSATLVVESRVTNIVSHWIR